MIKILLIDDVNISKIMQTYNNIEYCIEQFKSPLHAFNYIIKNLPDGIVINMNNSEIDSLSVYERIRNMPSGKSIPILLMGGQKEDYNKYLKSAITKHTREKEINKHVLERLTKILEVTSQEQNKEILLVDDSPIVLDTVKLYLEAHYKVEAMISPRAALEYLANKVPDLIILDIAMPEMDGITLMKEIRSMPKCQEVPVLFQTGLATKENIKECMELGAAAYIVKPVNKNKLLERIAGILEPNVDKKAIMVIDNYNINFTNIKNMLGISYNVLANDASIVALADLQEEKIDYIFINIDNALAFMDRVRDKAEQRNIPIVLVSADVNSETIKKELHDECKYVIKTPIDVDELETVLEKLEAEDPMNTK